MSAHADDDDGVQGAVGLWVAAAVEAVPDGLAAGGLQWRGTAQLGEGGVGGDSVAVVSECNEQGGGGLGLDTVQRE